MSDISSSFPGVVRVDPADPIQDTTTSTLTSILIELRVVSYLLDKGLNTGEDLDKLRGDAAVAVNPTANTI